MRASRRTKRWTVAGLLLGSVIVMTILLWPRDPHLFLRARPIAFVSQLQMHQMQSATPIRSIYWLSDHAFLYARRGKNDHYQFHRYDLHTRQSIPLERLTRLVNDSGGYLIDQVSPDGKWAVWRIFRYPEGRWFAAALEGTGSLSWPCKRISGEPGDWTVYSSSYVRWLADSRHVAEFVTDRDKKGSHIIHVFIHDVQTGTVTASLLRESSGMSTLYLGEIKLTSSGQALATDWDAWIYNDPNLGFMRTDLKFYSWSLHAPDAAPRHWELKAPDSSPHWIRHSHFDPQLLDLEVSPDGERLSWVLWRHKTVPWQALVQRFIPRVQVSSQERWEIWVSGVDGSNMRQIGYEDLPGPENNKALSIPTLPTLQWLPDGKQLSFIYKDVVYIVPAD
jgi:hypothetical protein